MAVSCCFVRIAEIEGGKDDIFWGGFFEERENGVENNEDKVVLLPFSRL